MSAACKRCGAKLPTPCPCPAAPPADPTNPAHYRRHPSGLECIELTETMSFCEGNAVKYLWRFRDKNGVEDLRKALWYARRVPSPPPRYKRAAAYQKWREWYTSHDVRPESLAINYLLAGLPVSAAQAIEALIAVQPPPVKHREGWGE